MGAKDGKNLIANARKARERERGRGARRGRLRRLPARASSVAHAPAAHALKAIAVANDFDRIEITVLGEAYEGRGDALQIEPAPGADGVRGRMSVPGVAARTDMRPLTPSAPGAVSICSASPRPS